MTDADSTPDDAASPDQRFDESLLDAESLLADADDLTAFYVGAVHDGEHLDAASASRADDAEAEGMQKLALLASHLRMVAEESGVDYETVARDAASLAERVDPE